MSVSTTSPLQDEDRIPLSLPAILRNPKAPIAAHLHQPARLIGKKKLVSSGGRPEPSKRWEGKRWTRRRENDLLTSNPHLTPPTRSDVSLHPSTLPTPTFPTPLPAHLLPRTRPAPSPEPPSPDPASALAGTFSLSLKGIRRTLRNRGARSEELVRIVEEELESWEQQVRASVVLMGRLNGRGGGGRVIDDYLVPSPDRSNVGSGGEVLGGLDELSRKFEKEDGTVPAIVEVARGEASLTWSVPEGFDRFVVHCVARHRNLVSFSKTTPLGSRLTYVLLRPSSSSSSSRPAPQPTFPSAGGGGFSLDTPPTTDLSGSSIAGGSGTDSEGASVQGGGKWEEDSSASEMGGDDLIPFDGVAVVAEAGVVVEGVEAAVIDRNEDDEYESSDDESASSIAMLSLSSSIASLDLDPNPTPTPNPPLTTLINESTDESLPLPPSTPRPSSRPSDPLAGAGAGAGTRTPRKGGLLDFVGGDGEGDETPTRRRDEGEGGEKLVGGGTRPRVGGGGGAGKKGSFWEFLYG